MYYISLYFNPFQKNGQGKLYRFNNKLKLYFILLLSYLMSNIQTEKKIIVIKNISVFILLFS